ncbi:hypothetical protein AVP42_02560 [Agromyces sp. NDB4Y10]|nr:hypothetical protein AVP42_02560 [Agromyces sp. NDB4Y10]
MPGTLATRRRAEALTRNRRHVPRQAGLAATHQHGCRGVTAMTRLSTPRRVTARLRAERRVLRAGDKAAATLPTPGRKASMPDPLRRVRRVAEHRHRARQVARHRRCATPAVVAGFVSAAFTRSLPCSSSRSASGACSMLSRWTTARIRCNAVATQLPSSARRVLLRQAAESAPGVGRGLGRRRPADDLCRPRPRCVTGRPARSGSLVATFHLREFQALAALSVVSARRRRRARPPNRHAHVPDDVLLDLITHVAVRTTTGHSSLSHRRRRCRE